MMLQTGVIAIASCACLAAAEPAQTGPVDKKAAAILEQELNPKKSSNLVPLQPRVLHYNEADDVFVYSNSRIDRESRARPGGSLAYYGSRLSQYRFLGPAKRGGLYSDLDDFKQQAQLNPLKYQYRFGNYSRNGDR